VAIIALLVVLVAHWHGGTRRLLNTLDLVATQARYKMRGEVPPADYVKVVGITENTISAFAEHNVFYPPLPRDWHAAALTRLADAGTRVVVIDILFTEKDSWDEAEDIALCDAVEYCRRHGCEVVLAAAIEQVDVSGARIESLIKPADVILEVQPHLGLSNTWDKLSYKQLEQVRASLPLGEGGTDVTYYSQAVEAFRQFCRQQGRDFQVELARAELKQRGPTGADQRFFLVNYFAKPATYAGHEYDFIRLFPELWLTEDEEQEPTGGAEQADDDWDDPPTMGSLRRELTADEQAALTAIFQDSVVFIGSCSRLDNDYFNTPFGQMFGVETNAQAFDTLARGRLIKRVPGGMVRILVIILALLAWGTSLVRPIWRGALAGIIILLILGLANSLLFTLRSIELTQSTTALGFILPFVACTVFGGVAEEMERRRIRFIFGRYVSDAIVEQIIDNPEFAGLGGVERTVAVLFNDIRSYSTITERLTPHQIVEFLNIYLSEVTEVIQDNNGFVDKYLGDGLMAFFGAPVPTKDPCGDAIRAGLQMIRGLHDNVHARMRELGMPEFKVGVGVHVGPAVMGNIGSERRHDYTLIGDAVNVAARVESETKNFGWAVVVTREVMEAAVTEFDFELVGSRQVKGREQPVEMYRVVDPQRPEIYQLPAKPVTTVAVPAEAWVPPDKPG